MVQKFLPGCRKLPDYEEMGTLLSLCPISLMKRAQRLFYEDRYS
jgi:hypothetical protein